MKRLIVQIGLEEQPEPMEMEIRADLRAKDLLSKLIEAMGLQAQDDDGSAIAYWLELNNLPVPGDKTLTDWGVGNGDLLAVRRSAPTPKVDPVAPASSAPPADDNQDAFSTKEFDFEFDSSALLPKP